MNAPPALTTGTLDTSAASQTTATGVATVSSGNVQSVSLPSNPLGLTPGTVINVAPAQVGVN